MPTLFSKAVKLVCHVGIGRQPCFVFWNIFVMGCGYPPLIGRLLVSISGAPSRTLPINVRWQTSHMRPVNWNARHTHISTFVGTSSKIIQCPYPLNPNLTPFLTSPVKTMWKPSNRRPLTQIRWRRFCLKCGARCSADPTRQVVFPHPPAFPEGHPSCNISVSPFSHAALTH